MSDALKKINLDPAQLKQELKDEKAEKKAKAKEEKKAAKEAARQRGDGETKIDEPTRKVVYVLDFDGDIRGSAVNSMRREISAILTTAKTDDEVVVRLESGGGMVASYGLGASQLDRIRKKGIPLTVCIDKVAASGGYMMACVASKILAAPFAIVGSIGVRRERNSWRTSSASTISSSHTSNCIAQVLISTRSPRERPGLAKMLCSSVWLTIY